MNIPSVQSGVETQSRHNIKHNIERQMAIETNWTTGPTMFCSLLSVNFPKWRTHVDAANPYALSYNITLLA